MRRMLPGTATVLAAAFAVPLAAQGPPLVLPKASPRASVSQQIALAEISITYDRPAVAGGTVRAVSSTRCGGGGEREHGDRFCCRWVAGQRWRPAGTGCT
jgi:hypothetical protein